MDNGVFSIGETPLHLGLGASAEVLPPFTGDMSWYADYGETHGADGNEGRLVTLHTFDESWDHWEVHPYGHEVVLCLSGRMTLHQEDVDGNTRAVTIGAGEGVINDPGTWHTAAPWLLTPRALPLPNVHFFLRKRPLPWQ